MKIMPPASFSTNRPPGAAHQDDPATNRPLRICMISYRSNPHCGGQGVYLKRLCRALKDLGHHVEVVTGPPDPCLDADIPVHKIPCLDLLDPEHFCRLPTPREFMDPVNVLEWLGICTMGFPEPYTFGLRARRFMRGHYPRFDVVHDNQSLSYGLLTIKKYVPTVVTIHHPITRDRLIDIRSARFFWQKMKWHRWYSFLKMQKEVSRQFGQVITVSKCSRNDIAQDFDVPLNRFRVVPNGISTDLFFPIPEIPRDRNRLIVTNSADMPLKGLAYLLPAVAETARHRDVRLTVIGTPKKRGLVSRLVRDLGIGHLVTFTGRVTNEEFVRLYARAGIAVVPSVYEGFGLPAGEAMACGVPVISTTGGALTEVVGDAGVLVPPKNSEAITKAVIDLLDNPGKAEYYGRKGYQRVQEHFTWRRAAEKTAAAYREAIRDHG